MAVLWYVPSNHYLFLPDPARPVDPLVHVPKERAERAKGGVYMVDVLVRRASVFERVFPELHDGATLVPEDELNPVGVSEDERRKSSLHEMSRSQKIAVAVALEEVGYDVKAERRGAEVALVRPKSPAARAVEIGDVIVQAKGEEVRSTPDLLAAMKSHRPGNPVTIAVLRNGKRREVEVGTQRGPNGRAVMGVVVQPSVEIDLPLDVRIDAGEVGGPSAGLAFALDVFDELGGDVDGGDRVAATGELDLDGSVAAVGGIPQKTIGARLSKADVLIVPDTNAKEARRHADGLRVVAVSTFEEALSALRQ